MKGKATKKQEKLENKIIHLLNAVPDRSSDFTKETDELLQLIIEKQQELIIYLKKQLIAKQNIIKNLKEK